MTIDLYINDRKADIGDKDAFARTFKQTKQFSDMENPSKIVTDYSYSISLPGTDTNRSIFGFIETGTDPYSFNPNAKHPYALNVNGYLFSQGTCQLTEITVESGKIVYKCGFYSSVHDVIMDLSGTALKDLSVFDDNNSYYHFLNRESMSHFWIGDHKFASMLRYIPTRAGMYQNFTSSKMMAAVYDSNSNSNDTSSGLGTEQEKGDTGTLLPSSYIGIDLGADYDEYAMRDYRIEYQRPAVSVLNIMKGLVDDFKINVDASLMDSPYVNRSWMMCPQLALQDKSEDCFGTFTPYNLPIGESAADASGNINNLSQTSALSTGDQIFTSSAINPKDNCFSVTVECCLQFDCSANGDTSQYGGNYNQSTIYYEWGNSHYPVALLKLEMSGASISPNEGVFSTGPNGLGSLFFSRTGGSAMAGEWASYRMYSNNIKIDGWTDRSLIPVRFSFSLAPANANYAWLPAISVYDITHELCSSYSASSSTPEAPKQMYEVGAWNMKVIPIESLSQKQISQLQQAGYSGHTLSYTAKAGDNSPLYVNMDTLFGSTELSCKDFLTDFTKMTGCLWDFDSSGNFNIVTRNNYFKGYKVKDWTHKLDRKNVTYKPMAFDKRKYTFSYKPGDSLLENNFKDETGKDYGKQYIDTGYAFNDEVEPLLETKFLNTVQCTGQRKAVVRNTQGQIRYINQTAYELPMIEKKDNGAPNEGFRLLFNNGLTSLPKGENVFITQDSSFMYSESIGGKCWMDFTGYANAPAIGGNIAIMSVVPKFSTRWNNASWDFAKPQISYSGETDLSYPNDICLYPRFWNRYIGALYDIRVRVMTANFWLDTEDLLQFSFRDFVMIDNHLWHVNKLIDFDISGEHLTKAELVEVLDPEAWVNGQDWSFDSSEYGAWGLNTNYPNASTVQPILPGQNQVEPEQPGQQKEQN